jgi:putative FmdB family regulatory protein
MPTYEYRCLDCHEVFEQPAKMAEHDAARPICPACGSKKVEQVFSAFFAKTSRKS